MGLQPAIKLDIDLDIDLDVDLDADLDIGRMWNEPSWHRLLTCP